MFQMGYKPWHGNNNMRLKYDSIITFTYSWLLTALSIYDSYDSLIYGYCSLIVETRHTETVETVLPKDPKRGLKKATPKLRASAVACQWFFPLIHLFIWL